MIGQTKIIKGSVNIPSELRMKYKMYEYTPVVFIEMENGIMIKSLINNNDKNTKEKTEKEIVPQYPNLEKEIVTVMKSLEAFMRVS